MQIYSRYSSVATISGEPVPIREALAAINRTIANYDERQEGDLDSESRFCLDWLKQHGYEAGAYGDAETLARAKNVAIAKLQDVDGVLTAAGGRVTLLPLDAFSGRRAAPPLPPHERGGKKGRSPRQRGEEKGGNGVGRGVSVWHIT